MAGSAGKLLPFCDGEFGIVWTWQSLEHVHEPETTISEIARCLHSGGICAGSTSFLEPYHAQSTFSYTPYGLQLLLARHGLKVIEIAPGLDGLAYFVKRLGMALGVVENPPHLQSLMGHCQPLAPVRAALKQAGREPEFVHLDAQLCCTFRFMAVKSG